jgi:hypothetical protein
MQRRTALHYWFGQITFSPLTSHLSYGQKGPCSRETAFPGFWRQHGLDHCSGFAISAASGILISAKMMEPLYSLYEHQDTEIVRFRSMLWLAFILTIVGAIAMCPLQLFAENTFPSQSFDISLPEFTLAKGERVVKFECTLQGGSIERIKTPPWSITIDNGSVDTAKATGSITVGAAALTEEELGFFHNFITVSKSTKSYPYVPQFRMRIVIWISTNQEMTTFRRLTFSTDQLLKTGTLVKRP